jgi:hypothetical protein
MSRYLYLIFFRFQVWVGYPVNFPKPVPEKPEQIRLPTQKLKMLPVVFTHENLILLNLMLD